MDYIEETKQLITEEVFDKTYDQDNLPNLW